MSKHINVFKDLLYRPIISVSNRILRILIKGDLKESITAFAPQNYYPNSGSFSGRAGLNIHPTGAYYQCHRGK